jgi:hypothetical protein
MQSLQTRAPSAGANPQAVPEPAAAAASPWLDRLPLCASLLLVFLLGCHEMADSDLWWHLRTAQLIVARGTVPTTDWFTYSSPDARWTNINWLWELCALGVWQLAGVPGLIIGTSCLAAATFALLLAQMNRGRVAPFFAALLAVPPILLLGQRIPVRPETIAFLFLAVSLTVCDQARRRPRLLWLLPAIQVLWVNCHGSFILELVVVGCFTAESVTVALWRRKAEALSETGWRTWTLVSAACLGACLVNPYGINAFKLVMVLSSRMGSSETAQFYRQLASELNGFELLVARQGPAAVDCPKGLLLLAATLLVTCSFAPLLWSRRGIKPSRLLLTILFAHLGWQTFKNMPFFAITALAVALWNLDDCWDVLPGLVTRDNRLRAVGATLLLLPLAVSIPTNTYYAVVDSAVRPRFRTRFGLGELAEESPHTEAQFLGRPGMPGRVFANDHTLAAGYIFHNGPERKVFVDGRLEVATRESYQRYLQITDLLVMHDPLAEKMLLADVPADAAGKREMPAVILQMDAFLGAIENLVEHPRWRPVFYGSAAIVFLYEPDAERRAVPAVDKEKLRIHLWRRALEVRPNSPKVHLQLGQALRHSDPVEAAQHLRQAREISAPR